MIAATVYEQGYTLEACSQRTNWTELTRNKSTQLHDAFIGHARRRHDLIGCSETRTVGAQTVIRNVLIALMHELFLKK